MQNKGAIPGSREPDPSCTGSGPSGFDPERKIIYTHVTDGALKGILRLAEVGDRQVRL